MKYLKPYKIFESSEDDVDYFKSMLSDLEDDGYKIDVGPYSNPNSNPYYGAYSKSSDVPKEDGITITIVKGIPYSDPIIISDITDKIRQILAVTPEYSILNIVLDYITSGRDNRLEYKSLDDIKVKDMLKVNGFYSVLEYGMDEWINEMTLIRITKPYELFSGPGYKYHFGSSHQDPGGEPEELEIEIGEKDIEEDVRPCIKWIRIYLDRK
jgi:hypothetical protein